MGTCPNRPSWHPFLSVVLLQRCHLFVTCFCPAAAVWLLHCLGECLWWLANCYICDAAAVGYRDVLATCLEGHAGECFCVVAVALVALVAHVAAGLAPAELAQLHLLPPEQHAGLQLGAHCLLLCCSDPPAQGLLAADAIVARQLVDSR